MEDSGALPIELDVSNLNMGDVITIYPYEGKVERDGELVTEFELKTSVILDRVRAGGRIPLIVGRGLTVKALQGLGQDGDISLHLPKEVQQDALLNLTRNLSLNT